MQTSSSDEAQRAEWWGDVGLWESSEADGLAEEPRRSFLSLSHL